MKISNILNVGFCAVDLTGATQIVLGYSVKKIKGLVVTPNVDHLVSFRDDPLMKKIFEDALVRFCDGMPIVWYSKTFCEQKLPTRVAGSDLIFSVCEAAALNGQSIYLMGGQPGSCQLAIERLVAKYPKLNVVGYSCPDYGFENDDVLCETLISEINSLNPDILILGLGTPKQEKWAAKYLDRIRCGPVLCLGAAIDLAAGKILRAPLILQKTGLEWLWRLMMEPRRLWRRYLVKDTFFFIMVIKDLCFRALK